MLGRRQSDRAPEAKTEGRREGLKVAIHSNVFHRVLEPVPVRQWQVEQRPDALTLRIVPGQAAVDPASISAALAAELTATGSASVPIKIEIVAAVEEATLGKAPLIKRHAS